MKNVFYVYELQYPNGTPFYVGKGCDDRCYTHLYQSKIINTSNRYKSNIIRKILKTGLTPTIKKVAIDLSETLAFEIEISLIAYYGRRDNKTGILCNMTDGGEGMSGLKHSEKAKKKMSKSKKNNDSPFKDKCWDDYPESLEIMRTKLQKKHPAKRVVNQYDKTGNFITTYISTKEVERKLGIKNQGISACCLGKQQSAGGYVWRYE